MVRQNLGKLDRVFRFLLAFWWLGPWAPTFAANWANTLVVLVGWVALVESFVGWCFCHDWFKINNRNQ